MSAVEELERKKGKKEKREIGEREKLKGITT
jgi:hypothetical protein